MIVEAYYSKRSFLSHMCLYFTQKRRGGGGGGNLDKHINWKWGGHPWLPILLSAVRRYLFILNM